MNTPKYAILHHTADASAGNQLRKVDEFHHIKFGMRSRLGYWVGYHYFVERNGTVIQTRADDEEGAHTRGHNSESLGICLAGNFDLETPTFAQMEALNKLIDNLSVQYEKDDFPLQYHFSFSDTHCPGAYFQSNPWRIVLLQRKLTLLQRILLWLKTHYLN